MEGTVESRRGETGKEGAGSGLAGSEGEGRRGMEESEGAYKERIGRVIDRGFPVA